jgi:hypothetical protein
MRRDESRVFRVSRKPWNAEILSAARDVPRVPRVHTHFYIAFNKGLQGHVSSSSSAETASHPKIATLDPTMCTGLVALKNQERGVIMTK